MKLFLRFFLLSLFLTGISLIHAQDKFVFAIINDPDGFLNVRSGPGSSYEISDRIFKGELMEVIPEAGKSWWKTEKIVYAAPAEPRQSPFQKKTGYIFAKRITLLTDLPIEDQILLLFSELHRDQLLHFSFRLKLDGGNRSKLEGEIMANDGRIGLVMRSSIKALAIHNEFSANLRFFQQTEILAPGSADEGYIIFLAELFTLSPDRFITYFQTRGKVYSQGIANSLLLGLGSLKGEMEAARYDALVQELTALRDAS